MKKLSFILIVGVCVVLLVGLSPAVLFSSTCEIYCMEPHNQEYPAIFERKIVWVDYRNHGYSGSDIYMYDAGARLEVPICTADGDQLFPAISGNKIVWQDQRKGENLFDIYMYDLATGQETPICVEDWDQVTPAISGDRIVWSDGRDSTISKEIRKIYMYDLATGVESPVHPVSNYQTGPAISGDRIVWVDWRDVGTAPDIYMYDLATGQETAICTDSKYQGAPRISGDKIVWEDNRNGDWDIYMYDIATGEESPICSLPGSNQEHPVISGDWIAWQDNRSGDWNTYMSLYQFLNKQEMPVCPNATDQISPAVYSLDPVKAIIVWVDYQNGNADIYSSDHYWTTGSGCWVPSLYGGDSEEVALLRKFRDEVLSATPEGQEIIKLYYEWSPVIVEVMNENEEFKAQVKTMVDGVIPLIRGEVD